MMNVLAIALGGSIGALLRFFIAGEVNKQLHSSFPFGTLTVNLLGSFIIGFAYVFFTVRFPDLPPQYRGFVIVGMLGALTTYSSYVLDALTLMQAGDYNRALLYLAVTLVGAMTAVILGYSLGKLVL